MQPRKQAFDLPSTAVAPQRAAILDRHSGEIKEVVRLARYVEPSNSRMTDNYIELKRADGDVTVLRVAWRTPPRNGGRALFLFCPYCAVPRRHVYGWEWDSFSGW